MRARIPDDQVRYYAHPLELQLVSLWPPLVHPGMPEMQIEDLQPMRCEGLK